MVDASCMVARVRFVAWCGVARRGVVGWSEAG